MPYMESSSVRHPIFIMLYSHDENEITYAITERGLKWNYKAEFSFRVCFGKVGAIEGRDVLKNIDGMIQAVDAIICEIEAESRMIGILAR
jgi:hypothetical protein